MGNNLHWSQEDLDRINLKKLEDKKPPKKPRKTRNTHEENVLEVHEANLKEKVVTGKLMICWSGKSISLNEWYSSKHWTHRSKAKKEWHKFFRESLNEGPHRFRDLHYRTSF